jgi:hypothetical protein
MNINEMMDRTFEAEEGERFIVDGIGHIFAQKVKKENASLDTPYGTVVGSVILDFDGKLGLVGYDKAGAKRVLVYQNGKWQGGPLSLKDTRMTPVLVFVGQNGIEIKELTMTEGKELNDSENEEDMIKKLLETSPENIESETKEGDTVIRNVMQGSVPVIIRNNENNKQLRPELIGKLGHIVRELHSPQGLRFEVLVGEDVYNLDWRDVKGRNI